MPNSNPEKDKANRKAWREANPTYSSDYYEKNKEKIITRTTEYAKLRPEWRKEISRKATLKVVGWTVEEYDATFVEQNGVCAICGKPELLDKRLSADHDHDKLTKRGLLCQLCNAGIGMLMDSSTILEAAIAYLRKYGK